MIVIICLDDNYGMMFNRRRQSQDRKIIDIIIEITKDKQLWMNKYSYSLFENVRNAHINIDERFLSETPNGEYCFVEDKSLKPYEQWIEKLIIFKWNAKYPTDFKLDISLHSDKWKCTKKLEFIGKSHKQITMEVYEYEKI